MANITAPARPFFSAKGSKKIYSSKTGKPFKSEKAFVKAGGTPYWREGADDTNVQIVSSPEQAQETAEQLQKGSIEFTPPEEKVFDTDKTKDLSAFLESLQSQQQRRLKELREEREKARTEKKDLMTKMKEATIDRSKLLKEQREKYDMEENIQQQQTLIDEASVLRTELADVESQKRQALMEEEAKPLSSDYIQGQKALIERQYNSRIQAKSARLNAKTATIQALQGNLSQARTLANEMVNAETWDYKQKRNNIAREMQNNKDALQQMGREYQNTWQNALDTAQTRYENKRKRAQQKKNLLIDAASQGVNLGDVTDMSLKEAQNAYAEQVGAVQAEKRELTMAQQRAQISGADETTEDQTQTERAITEASTQFEERKGEDGYVSWDDYLDIRASSAISTSEFDSRFARIYLSEGNRDSLQKLKEENISLNSIAG